MAMHHLVSIFFVHVPWLMPKTMSTAGACRERGEAIVINSSLEYTHIHHPAIRFRPSLRLSHLNIMARNLLHVDITRPIRDELPSRHAIRSQRLHVPIITHRFSLAVILTRLRKAPPLGGLPTPPPHLLRAHVAHQPPHLRAQEVPLDARRAARRLRGDQVDADHHAAGLGALHCNLRPRAWREAQVHDDLVAAEDAVLGVELFSVSAAGASRKNGGKGAVRALVRTSSNLKAARLLSPITLASRAKRSRPWRAFHWELDDEWRRVSVDSAACLQAAHVHGVAAVGAATRLSCELVLVWETKLRELNALLSDPALIAWPVHALPSAGLAMTYGLTRYIDALISESLSLHEFEMFHG